MLLATGIKVLETLIGTATKLGTSALVKKAGKTIWDRFKKEPESTENKELLRITRIAYLRASLAACRQLLKHGYERESINSNARQTLNDLGTYLSGQIKEARSGEWFRSSLLTKAFEVLINSSDEDQDELLKKTLQDLLLGEINQANILPINAYQDLLINGWQEAGKQMNWLELMASSLQEELAKNEVAQSTLQLKFWDELNQKLSGFDTHWQQLEDHLITFSEYHQAFWQKLEDMHTDQQAGFKAAYEGQAELSQDVKDAKEEIKRDTKQIIQTLEEGSQIVPKKHLGVKPAPPEVFLGRDEELEELHKLLFSDQHFILLVNGRGGVGKTSIASEYYHRHGEQYNKLAWVQSDKSITDALLTLIRGLKLSFDPKATEPKKLDAVLHELGNLEKPSLLVIDNANKLKDLNANYRHLAGLTNIHLLITTRVTEFRKAKMYDIDGLSEKDTWLLFKAHYTKIKEEEKPTVLSIREAVYANTLVIELLAKNLKELNRREQKYTLNDLLDDLRKKGILKISQSREVDVNYQHFDRAKPEEVITAMYDLAGLSGDEKLVLSCIAILPTEPVRLVYLKLIFKPLENYDEILTTLNQKGWIEYIEKDNAFKWSPVVQEIVRFKNQNLVQDTSMVISSLGSMLDDEVIHIDNYSQAGTFVRYAETALSHIREPNHSTAILLQNIGNYYGHTGDLNKCLTTYGLMEKQFKAILLQNPDPEAQNGLAISYEKLGETHSALGNLDQALRFFEKDIDLSKELFKDYPNNVDYKNNLAVSYFKLGELERDKPNGKEKAIHYFRKCQLLLQELVEQAKGHREYQQNLQEVTEAIQELED